MKRIIELNSAPQDNLISVDALKKALEDSEPMLDIQHISVCLFEYKRIGSIAKAKLFGLTFFKKVGDLSILFGVNWLGHSATRIH